MAEIVPVHRNETKDQSANSIAFFEIEESDSKLESYDSIINKIASAKEFICLASTGQIDQQIIEVLYNCIERNLRVYIIFKSFENSSNTLAKFSKKKPALIRQVPELANNMIFTDTEATLFVNDIGSKENIAIRLEEKQSKDLFYTFNYYFWDKSDLEKILDDINTPRESPYPSLKKINEYINVISVNEDTYHGKVTVPFKSDNREYYNESLKEFSFSKDITTPIISNDHTIIGNLSFTSMNIKNHIGNRWKLTTKKLKDISTNVQIIPIEDNWNKTINIKDKETVEIQAIRASSIDEMGTIKPKEFPERKYSRSILYDWIVLPPIKAKGAKLSSIYNDFDNLMNNFTKDLDYLDGILEKTVDDKSRFLLDYFFGKKSKAIKDREKISKYRKYDLRSLKSNQLNEFIRNEFSIFYNDVCSSQEELKNDIEKKQQEEKWIDEKREKEHKRETKSTELDELNRLLALHNELDQLKAELDNKEDKDTSKIDDRIKEINIELEGKPKQENLKKQITHTSGELKSIEKDLENNYRTFVFKPQTNELKNLKKGSDHSVLKKYQIYQIPKFTLPEVGVLFEDKEKYYLEISKYEELTKAKEISQNRYTDKKCEIVVKEN